MREKSISHALKMWHISCLPRFITPSFLQETGSGKYLFPFLQPCGPYCELSMMISAPWATECEHEIQMGQRADCPGTSNMRVREGRACSPVTKKNRSWKFGQPMCQPGGETWFEKMSRSWEEPLRQRWKRGSTGLHSLNAFVPETRYNSTHTFPLC